MSQTTFHIHIFGKVQGVFFRANACKKARELRVTGWVANLPDGSVEAIAQGSPTAVQTFIEWCKSGPAHASVDRAEATELTTEERYSDFSIR